MDIEDLCERDELWYNVDNEVPRQRVLFRTELTHESLDGEHHLQRHHTRTAHH